MNQMKPLKQIILASKSPRRKELFERFDFPFVCMDAQTDEVIDLTIELGQAIELVARQKASKVAQQFPEALVIGADTIVTLDGNVFGKPADIEDARNMLERLSGRSHQVITAVCLQEGERIETFHSVATVYFYPLTKSDIDWYLATNEPMDKAGAYGIQGYGAFLVDKIDGDFFTIMGLPVALLHQKLKEWG